MVCPTCDHTLSLVNGIYWCERCGTLKSKHDDTFEAPKLVERCRQYAKNITISKEWRQLGIAESINKPEDRPA